MVGNNIKKAENTGPQPSQELIWQAYKVTTNADNQRDQDADNIATGTEGKKPKDPKALPGFRNFEQGSGKEREKGACSTAAVDYRNFPYSESDSRRWHDRARKGSR